MINKSYKLNNGVKIPAIGLGTWQLDNTTVVDAIRNATSLGYRLIDTAKSYGNEHGVGIGIKECGISRSELFLTTKIPSECKSYNEAVTCIDEALTTLDEDYIDLMIIHSPEPWSDFRNENHYFSENIEVYNALEDAYMEGKLRSIGLSNFLEVDVDNILDNCSIKPMVNQILCHIGSASLELINYCNSHDILIEAYSPIAHGVVFGNRDIQRIADKYDVSVAALCMKYIIELGCVPIPKSGNIKHMQDNLDVNFSISNSDMDYLKSLVIDDYGELSIHNIFGGKNLPRK
ncbi:aldo/keto reductase [Methanosphaera sp. WGK6]|uniref:aldo/keto reductase family protein n=1 Tax=Methanosphaera sp. WGK6 TaxID=1561964 RepID=UPI00084C2485|nr:aldo/keto reductase [Methanosphaera sp. WGK6]OED30423.1 2,5-diketo-D-gluconic acid reductase [Methanosphaera sp. WGK6]